MVKLFPVLITLFLTASATNFPQSVEIDTSQLYLYPTPPFATSEEALEAHKEFEKRVSKNKIDLFNDYYLIFRYRDPSFIKIWLNILAENNKNPLLTIWFINAVEQMGDRQYLRYISPFKNSSNSIIRECVANSYGFLAPQDSLQVLKKWLADEKNRYVCKTIAASMQAIQNSGYKNRIKYLPRYYDDKPLKLDFMYNRRIKDDPSMFYMETDTGYELLAADTFVYPHQQYLYPLKNSPKRGFFGSQNRGIYHIGKDSGWLLEGLPVHAICNGVVKQITHCLSWGFLVVVESVVDDKDTICTIYGHLSPYNNLKAGDTVYTGDRIGQIGNSVTPDNGGYWAHLHCGIEKRPYYKATIAGYAYDTTFNANPVNFIRDHVR